MLATDLPALKAVLRLGADDDREQGPLYDVRFCPYTKPGEENVFAVAGGENTLICRPVVPEGQEDVGIEVLQHFRDVEADDPEDEPLDRTAILNSCAWTRDFETDDPLLCVTGVPPKIKILNVRTGKLVRSIRGHGRLINDLQISPLSPFVLASSSMDESIRLWNLEPQYANNPCSALIVQAHKRGVLDIGFHHTGRWLVSGGFDTSVKIWHIPELPTAASGTDKVQQIIYPHFSTTELHSDFVDCAKFHKDLLISRGCGPYSRIYISRINGFPPSDSSAPPPPCVPPSDVIHTASAFLPDPAAAGSAASPGPGPAMFERLLSLRIPDADSFFNRFSLFSLPSQRPILCFGNCASKVYFWDLQRLEEGSKGKEVARGREGEMVGDAPPGGATGLPEKVRGKFPPYRPAPGLGREGSHASNASHNSLASHVSLTSAGSRGAAGQARERDRDARKKTPVPPVPASVVAPEARARWGPICDPFVPIPPHKTVAVPEAKWMSRQVGWSNGGEWCVVVGDRGMLCVFGRWLE